MAELYQYAPEMGEKYRHMLRAFVAAGGVLDPELDDDVGAPETAHEVIWLLCDGEQAVGLLAIRSRREYAELRLPFLLTGYRGRGHESAMLGAAVAWADDVGYREVRVSLSSANGGFGAALEHSGFMRADGAERPDRPAWVRLGRR